MAKSKRAILTLITAFIASLIFSGLLTINAASAAAPDETVNVAEEVGKINSLADAANSKLKFGVCNARDTGGEISYEGADFSQRKYLQSTAAANGDDFEAYYINGLPANGVSSLEYIALRDNALFSVGIWDGADKTANRYAFIEYSAPQSGYVTIPASVVRVIEYQIATQYINGKTFNADLGFAVLKNAEKVYPQDSSWQTVFYRYAHTIAEDIVIPVSAGDKISVNFYAVKISAETTGEACVSFTWDLSFKFAASLAQGENLHKYNYIDKLTHDGQGRLINDLTIADDDAATYPFQYKYRWTSGNEYGYPGQQKDPFELLDGRRSHETKARKNLYASNDCFTGVTEYGEIVAIAVEENPCELGISFTAPKTGSLSIKNLTIIYGDYPNNTNDYTFPAYDDERPSYRDKGPFLGFTFSVLLNGKQVYPQNGECDDLCELYHMAKNGFAAGDLKPYQKAGDIDDILVKQYDEVIIVFSRYDKRETAQIVCDRSYINADFVIDTSADMSGYVDIVSLASDIDLTRENSADNRLSYYYYDITENIFNPQKVLLSAADWAENAYCSGLFDDDGESKVSINYNSLYAAVNRDAVLCYKASGRGNVTISVENYYRNGKISLFEFFDDFTKGLNQSELLKADGVRMRIEKNGKRVWPADKVWQEYKPNGANMGVFDFEDLTIGVNDGDVIAIRVNIGSDDNYFYDKLNFSPIFSFVAGNPIEDPVLTTEDPTGENINNNNCGGCKSKADGIIFAFGMLALALIVNAKRIAANKKR
jgi:hypothetical protein